MYGRLHTTAFVFLIVIGAHVFAPFLALSEIPQNLGAAIVGLDVGRFDILAIILICYIILGTFMEGFAILVLNLPIVDPLIRDLGGEIKEIYFTPAKTIFCSLSRRRMGK